jgi:hypothetical protein
MDGLNTLNDDLSFAYEEIKYVDLLFDGVAITEEELQYILENELDI